MGDLVLQRNVGALIDGVRLSDQAALTAAGTGDATTVTGQTIDREGFSSGSLPNSALITALFSATLASGKTLSVTFDLQDSADGTNFSDYATSAAVVVATGPSGGGVVRGPGPIGAPGQAASPNAEFAVSLTSARRYLRLLFVPDLNAAGTDTAVVIASGAFGGFDLLAAPQG